MTYVNKIYILLLLIVFNTSCKKFVELPPPDDRLTGSSIYATNATATSVLNGLFIRLAETNNVISSYATSYMGFSADELTNYNTNSVSEIFRAYQNNLTPSTELYWNTSYALIYNCNVAIEGLQASQTLNSGLKQQLLGEAKFIRALLYYYMVNTYGKVPLIITADYRLQLTAKRAEVAEVYAQIISDLKDAQSKLSREFLNGDALTAYPVANAERVRPTYWAATALLSRIYLYTKQWSEAEANSAIVINNSGLFSLVTPNSVFLKNSGESIFQLQPVIQTNYALFDARTLVLTSSVGTSANPASLSDGLIESFEAGDLRRASWVGNASISGKTYLFAYKYKANTASLAAEKPEYLCLLRLAEQYLIRAEARVQQSNLSGATEDVNSIRTRAGLSATSATTQIQLLDAIMQERRIELFCEEGHRWFDIKRTGRVDAVMSVAAPLKGGSWQSFKQLVPIPSSEISKNSNLDQNPGYN